MRLKKERTAENRLRILDAAARLFRQHGIDRVSVAELMHAAGFTHGGFYNHFTSKDALAAEACAHVFARAHARLVERLRTGSAAAWQSYVTESLALDRVEEPTDDAMLAALAADAARQSAEVQATFADGIEATVRALSAHLRGSERARTGSRSLRSSAVRSLSSLVGACVLARAVSRANPELGREILAANRPGLGPEAARDVGTRRTRVRGGTRGRRSPPSGRVRA